MHSLSVGHAPKEVKATLAICTQNRLGELLKTLEGLLLLRCSFNWELLVVDNGSEDGSAGTADEFAKSRGLPARVILEPRKGVSFARNCALETAHAEILVFIDDDMDCYPNLLESHVQAFEDPRVYATGGRILPLLPEGTPDWLTATLHDEVGGPTGRYDFGMDIKEIGGRGRIALPFSGNLGLRREVALRVGGFRTDLGWTKEGRRIGSEDTDLLNRISPLNGKILYLPEATVIHRVQPDRVTKQYYVTWNIGYGRSSVLMRGRRGAAWLVVKVLEQLFRVLRYTVFPYSLLFDSKAKRLRKRYQAIGRILELLRIRPRTP